MRQLNPTLWRTCRMLSGHTRLRLLQKIFEAPGQTVTQLADAVGIGVSDSSQELRRIQSRGILQVDRKGPCVIYRPAPDPQVPSAAPLLKVLKSILTSSSSAPEEDIVRITTALAHPRRINIAQALLAGPRSMPDLEHAVRISRNSLNRHLRAMTSAGLVRKRNKQMELIPSPHPLARTLIHLLRP